MACNLESRFEDIPDLWEHVRFDGARVLLVEDHILNIKVVARLLQAKGVRVHVAKNGKLGVEKFSRSEPGFYDLIIMDIRMPEMDGLTAARIIRGMEREDAGSIPIIAMSANVLYEDVEKSRMAGMNGHLAKPIDLKVMYRMLAENLPPEKVAVS